MPLFLAAGASFVINKLRDSVEQSPGGAGCGYQLGAMTLPLVQRLHLLERTLIHQALRRIDMAVGLAQDFEEVVHGLVALHLPLRQGLHAVT
jgi:hypothetical protein